MGIFNFLKRGPAAENGDGLEVKGMAYDTTVKSLPPIRGTLPVQGNGPNTLDDLQRSARLRSNVEPSSTNHSPAPSNRVSRLRSMSLGRPSTAPGGGFSLGLDPNHRPKSSASRRPRDASRAPSLVMAKRKSGPPYLLGMVGPGEAEDKNDGNVLDNDAPPPPVPPIADHFKQAPLSPGLASVHNTVRSDRGVTGGTGSLSGSLISSGTNTTRTAGGYVDILDAQGAFRPSDFRTRVKAAGVRDYGEDVADRNLGVNGVDLSSPAVMAFYALTGGEALVYKSDGSAIDVHGNKYAPGNIPTHLQSQDGVGKDENLAKANQSMRIQRFPTRTTSLAPRGEMSRTPTQQHSSAATGERTRVLDNAVTRRPLSVHGSTMLSSSPPPKARPLSMHPLNFSDFRSDDEAASVPDIPRIRPIPNGDSADIRSPRTQSRARDSVLVMKQQQHSPDNRPRSSSAKSARSKTKAKHQKTDSDESEAGGRQQSQSSAARRHKHAKARVDESSLDSYPWGGDDFIPPIPSPAQSNYPRSPGRQDSSPQSQRSWKASTIGQLTSPTATTAQNQDSTNQMSSRPSSSSSHPRNRSIGGSSAHGRTQLHDITEYIPNRRSSLSISSIPSSSLSSNPFPSSQSRHTANTSLDLGYALPLMPDTPSKSSKRGHFRGKGSDATVASTTRPSGYQEQRAEPPSNLSGQGPRMTTALDAFDDDMTNTDSSDIDSFVEKRRRKRPDDEGLLFREDAYGASGGGLPGLFSDDDRDGGGIFANSTRDAAAPPIWSSSLRHASFSNGKSATSRSRTTGHSILSSRVPPPIPSWDFSLPKYPKTAGNPSKYLYHPNVEQDDSSSITVSESDAGQTSRDESSAYENENGVLSAPGTYDAREREMDGQLDVKLAIRLRREMKRRERAQTASAPRPKSMGAHRAWENFEQGNVADAKF